MENYSNNQQKAQLDKAEREHLEDVVTEMRDRVEDNIRFQLTQRSLDDEPEDPDSPEEDTSSLVEAIELEAVDCNSWDDGFEQYVTSVGYTIVNRLAALRCMEVRGFIDEEVTAFKENGLTPAAETLVHEEFLLEDEAILEAYNKACDNLSEEIEILFDRSSAYSLVNPDNDTFEELCEKLDSISDEVWRADDVLGWVYEYYNTNLLEELRHKGNRVGLEPSEVAAANQFYTPHWVVRMLTDNSLGKLYLEQNKELTETIARQKKLSAEQRKNRPTSFSKSPTISDFCTYLVPSEENYTTDFSDPSEIRVIDPACGSGHFLLYSFDVLERIWRTEKPDMDHAEIPKKILKHNLYGVDIDMRACQLAAFNLYLKARKRAESEGADGFKMPNLGIVCADAKIAEIDTAEDVFDEVASNRPKIRDKLQEILESFENTHGLGSLLDVKGTLSESFEEGSQLTLGDNFGADHSLSSFLETLRQEISGHKKDDSFFAKDLRSFIRLLEVLSQSYDIALMNPPYGSQNRMPDVVQDYVKKNYKYSREYYINFFESCNNLTKVDGRVGMLVPRAFLYNHQFTQFRRDFVGEKGNFDFLAEFGIGVLDNATVRTVGTVVRSGTEPNPTGTFLRLHDKDSHEKEKTFAKILSGNESENHRLYEVDLNDFENIPRTPICYSTPAPVRDLYNTDINIDAKQAGIENKSACRAVVGLLTGDDDRFARMFWETDGFEIFVPIAKGGSKAWITPQITEVVNWEDDGRVLNRANQSVRTPHENLYGNPGLTWTFIKETGRRFGYYPGGLFSHTGFMLFPKDDRSLWTIMAALNSDLYHCLFLSQTTERNWNASVVGSVPWIEHLESIDELEKLSKKMYRAKLKERTHIPTSPYYISPDIIPEKYRQDFFHDHPHIGSAEQWIGVNNDKINVETEVAVAARQAVIKDLTRRQQLEKYFDQINQIVYDAVGISNETQEKIVNEIYFRTSEDPDDREIPKPKSVSGTPENIDQQVKNLVHHFAMEAVREEPDGIIPLHSVNNSPDMLDRIVDRFQEVYGEYAEDRLVEVDEILGARAASKEAYPNLRAFVEDGLFEYHVSQMENTPIIWKLTTERLLADSTGEGFACFLDYHSIDGGLFDRLSTQYLEQRKADLRERRSAADRRRSDDALSTTERADAAEQYEHCVSGLDQIAVFEDVIQQLGSTTEREFDDEARQQVEALAPKVAAFREETCTRVEALADIHDRKSEAWFKDTFSNKFWETVEEWQDEWIDALADLEAACEAYAKPVDEPVEAHLADLFDYFNWRLKGSDHYSSSGILFMTYYFEREGADLLDEHGEPFDTLTDDERLLASLAAGLDDDSIVDQKYLEAMVKDADEDVEEVDDLPPLSEFKALAEEIDDRCQSIVKQIPSDWADRALSEITTAGYQPNRKHGVDINITPLAEAEIVPKIVDDNVL